MSPSSIDHETAYHETAHAKINLFLHVTGRRDDGYHLLDSLVVFAELGDEVILEPVKSASDMPTDMSSLTITGPFGHGLHAGKDNLILRASQLLLEKAAQKKLITQANTNHIFSLVKNLPVASGIGGGSADAAATLRLLGRKWHEIASFLPDIAPALGADVPVCLLQNPTRMEGIGEKLTPAPALPPVGILLANPGKAVSTPSIFKRLAASGGPSAHYCRPDFPAQGWHDYADLINFLESTTNDLQPPAIAQEPVIADLLNKMAQLPGAGLVRMSGSGATCFALFETRKDAQHAEILFKNHVETQKWWCWAGGLKR